MSRSPISLPVLAIVSLVGVTNAAAQSGSTLPVPYTLVGPSNFAWGCYGPCDCAIREQAIGGTFRLVDLGFDGLFERYAVLDAKFLGTSNGDLRLAGSGTYRVGGEVAITQQLTLDLTVNDGAARHFDSGLVPGGGGFPKIDVAASLHQQQACFDTVIRVVAAPGGGTVDAGEVARMALAISPSPFRSDTRIDLSLATSARVELVIYDAAGRAVRNLASGATFEAGPHGFRWDGRRDGGEVVPPGVYFVRVSAGSARAVQAVVKLRG